MASFSPSRARACSCGTVTLFAAFWALMVFASCWLRPSGRRAILPTPGPIGNIVHCVRARRLALWRPGGAAQQRTPSGAVEELPPAAHLLHPLEQQLEVLGDVHEVQPLAVHDEERALPVVVEVGRIRLGKAPQVGLVDAGLG